MLAHSIASFRYFLSSDARYLVFTDNKCDAQLMLGKLAEVKSFDDNPATLEREFLEHQGTWRKWLPQVRISEKFTELRVDADMFLLREPIELLNFCFGNQNRWKYLVTLEEGTELWPYGNFAHLCSGVKHINAGLVGQAPGSNISELLRQQFAWWRDNIPQEKQLYHDEQGAVMAALLTSLREEAEQALKTVVGLLDQQKIFPLNYPVA